MVNSCHKYRLLRSSRLTVKTRPIRKVGPLGRNLCLAVSDCALTLMVFFGKHQVIPVITQMTGDCSADYIFLFPSQESIHDTIGDSEL